MCSPFQPRQEKSHWKLFSGAAGTLVVPAVGGGTLVAMLIRISFFSRSGPLSGSAISGVAFVPGAESASTADIAPSGFSLPSSDGEGVVRENCAWTFDDKSASN